MIHQRYHLLDGYPRNYYLRFKKDNEESYTHGSSFSFKLSSVASFDWLLLSSPFFTVKLQKQKTNNAVSDASIIQRNAYRTSGGDIFMQRTIANRHGSCISRVVCTRYYQGNTHLPDFCPFSGYSHRAVLLSSPISKSTRVLYIQCKPWSAMLPATWKTRNTIYKQTRHCSASEICKMWMTTTGKKDKRSNTKLLTDKHSNNVGSLAT